MAETVTHFLLLSLTHFAFYNRHQHRCNRKIIVFFVFGVKMMLGHVESFQNIFVTRKLLKMFEETV